MSREHINSYCNQNASGWNAPQRYAYPRIEYATANLWFGQNIESANVALVEYAEYFIKNPEQVSAPRPFSLAFRNGAALD